MFTLIFLIVSVLAFFCYKTRKDKLLLFFLVMSVLMLLVVIYCFLLYSYGNFRSSDLRENRKKLEAIQEDIQQLQKVIIETENEENFEEIFERLENEAQELQDIIDEQSNWLERGGKENIKFWLNFNLF